MGWETQYALTAASAVAIAWICWRLNLLRRGQAVAPARPAEATITWLGSYSVAFQRALDICGLVNVTLVDADPNRGIILGRTAFPPLGPGTPVKVTLRTQEGVTTVVFTVGGGVLDVGQSQRLTRRFVEIWDRMPDPAPAEK